MTLAPQTLARSDEGQDLASGWRKQSQSIRHALKGGFWRHAVRKASSAAGVRNPQKTSLQSEWREVFNQARLRLCLLPQVGPRVLDVLGSFLRWRPKTSLVKHNRTVKFPSDNSRAKRNEFFERAAA